MFSEMLHPPLNLGSFQAKKTTLNYLEKYAKIMFFFLKMPAQDKT